VDRTPKAVRSAAGRSRLIDSRFALIALLIAAVIIYGSLYPFEFRAHGGLHNAVASLLAGWKRLTSRGDIISNILLYIPLGIFAVNALTAGSRALRCGLVTMLGLCLSICVELVQFYELARSSTMSDIYFNTAGAFLGAVAGMIVRLQANLPAAKGIAAHPIPALLLAAFAGNRLFPYVPAIDLHKYWDALKPLFLNPTLSLADLYRHAASWLTVALLIEALSGVERRRWIFALLVPAVLMARILIVGTTLSLAEVCGAVLALLFWLGALSHVPFRAGIVAMLLVGAIVVQSLAPFQFQPVARPFGWIPFLSFVQGSIETNVRSMFEKVFTYGALLWLLTRAGVGLGPATAFSAAMIFALRYAQTYLPGRSAEITDGIIVLVLALVLRQFSNEPSPRARQAVAASSSR
jgi:VanZ family protein